MHVLHKQGPQMRSLNGYDPYFFNRKSASTTVPIRTSATASISDIVRSAEDPSFHFLHNERRTSRNQLAAEGTARTKQHGKLRCDVMGYGC